MFLHFLLEMLRFVQKSNVSFPASQYVDEMSVIEF